MFRFVGRGQPASGFYRVTRRTDMWFAPVMAVMFLACLALTPLAFERRHGETLYTLSIFSSSLILALALTSAFFNLINRSADSADVDVRLQKILKSLQRAMLQRPRSESYGMTAIDRTNGGAESFLLAPDNGYLQSVNFRDLSEVAARFNAVIHFLHDPGDFVLMEAPLASVGRVDEHALSDQDIDDLQGCFARSVSVGRNRSIKYDPEYAIVKITALAGLCMSTTLADPVTVLSCINTMSVALRQILRGPLHSEVHCDSMGQPRIFEKEIPPERVLGSAFDPLRAIVKSSVGLSVYLLQAISALAPFLNTPAQFLELRAQAELIHTAACLNVSLRERSALDDAYLSARRSLSCLAPAEDPSVARAWQQTRLSEKAS
jgi:uncharacterized membrane protein